MKSIGKVIKIFTDELKDIYSETEIKSIAELVLEKFLGYSKTELFLNKDEIISDAKYKNVEKALRRLKKNEPVQYILGETEFYGLMFNVAEGVLIPRPETEELVDWIINDYQKLENLAILDIGTGSGCIAISLATKLEKSNVYAFDISQKALLISRANAQLNNVEVKFIEKNILEKQQEEANDKFDVIVSNPPYVLLKEKELMEKNVLEFEPNEALFVDDNKPLLFYKAISVYAKLNLKNGGRLYFEINEAFGKETVLLLQNIGFENVELRKDLNGKDRMVCGRLP